MQFVTCYDNITNVYDHIIYCTQHKKECKMILVNPDYILKDDIIIMLNIFLPSVLSSIIIEYNNPYVMFSINPFYSITMHITIYISYGSLLIAWILCDKQFRIHKTEIMSIISHDANLKPLYEYIIDVTKVWIEKLI